MKVTTNSRSDAAMAPGAGRVFGPSGLAVASLVLSTAALVTGAWLATYGGAEPRTSSRNLAPPHAGSVTIYRDDWGVPHVFAQFEEDGYYGLGYALAEDRLESLLGRYVWARGELAATFDAGDPILERLISRGQRPLDVDLEHARWRHLEEARKGFEQLSPQLRRNYEYFVAGIRRYMEDHPEEVPTWAPELEPALPIVVSRARGWWNQGGSGAAKCARAGVEIAAAITDYVEDSRSLLPASNVWTLMPWRTADSVVIHVTDQHGTFEGTAEMFEFRLHAGALELAGSTFLGVPWIVAGHTRHTAIGVTHGPTDIADCYEVEVDPRSPRRYRYDGAWKEMIVDTAKVAVKGREPVTRILEYTDHNDVLSPVVARSRDKAYVVSTPYMHRAGRLNEQFYRQELARDMSELRAAQEMVEAPAWNFMAGDASGNTLYVRMGRVPIRDPGYDWSRPVPGNTSATAWKGIHPLEDLVHLENPPQGYMHNNNVAPDRMLEDSPLTAEQYPAYVYNDTAGRTNSRGARAIELLSSSFHTTVADAMEILFDEKWPQTGAWQRALRRALTMNMDFVSASSPQFRRFVDRLLHFDGFARRESVAALNCFYWWTALGADTARMSTLSDAVEAGRELSRDDNIYLLQGVERAIEALVGEHGSTELRYGDVFRIGRGGYSWGVGGGGWPGDEESGWRQRIAPLRNKWFSEPDANGQRWVIGGQRMPVLTVFTDPIQSFSSILVGQSGRPGPHYSDQARLMSERRLKPMHFEKVELLKHAVSTKVLDVRVQDEGR